MQKLYLNLILYSDLKVANILPGPWKTPGKLCFSLYSLKTPGFFLRMLGGKKSCKGAFV